MALVKILANCPPPCGVRLEGEVQTVSREFIHRFLFPAGVEGSVGAPSTEVEGMHLATFAPDSKDWFVPCPRCGKPIRFDSAIPRDAS